MAVKVSRYNGPMTADIDSLSPPDDTDCESSAIERRGAPRGPLRGLTATLPDIGTTPVLEAGVKDLFVALAENQIERYWPGDSMNITVAREELSFECQVEVIRAQQAPRRGLALRLIHMTPSAEATLDAMRS